MLEYCLIKLIAGVTPIPDATKIKCSLSIAGQLKGLKNGPTTKAGLSVGVFKAFMSLFVQSPDVEMQIDE